MTPYTNEELINYRNRVYWLMLSSLTDDFYDSCERCVDGMDEEIKRRGIVLEKDGFGYYTAT